jgi:hypothetical protein
VSAQSWHGLAPDDADRYRIVSAAEGGIWLLRTPHPEPVTDLAGLRRAVDTTRQLIGFPRWSRAGSSAIREIAVADPALVRALSVGQAAYLYRGGVTFVQVSRLVGTPAALGQAPVPATAPASLPHRDALAATSSPPPVPGGPPRPGRTADAAAAALPDVAPLLDAAFGPELGGRR